MIRHADDKALNILFTDIVAIGREVLNRKYAVVAAVILIVLIAMSLFIFTNVFSNKASPRQFYVGVDFAYGDQFSQVKALVDKVKGYTNLFVMGSLDLSFNKTALDESCDYIYGAGLSFIVFFTNFLDYNSTGFTLNSYSNYTIFDWAVAAKQKYGDKFLGIYRFDEPGGNQLDNGSSVLVTNATSYADAADSYVYGLNGIVSYYLAHGAPQVFTSDYGLYWFDYESSYSTVLAEFVGNQSRQMIIALDRGAAQSFNKNWGVIINWKYTQAPYLESGDELYADLSLAYSAGATYVVVFSYPNITAYGTLKDQHFEALQKFWNAIHKNPSQFPVMKAQAAYVIPQDYGFGFRSASDTIWGLFPPDALSPKIWNDTNALLAKYSGNLNVIYDDSSVIGPALNKYVAVYYWNQTIA